MRVLPLGPLVGAAALAALLPLTAAAGVNVEVDPNAKITGTLDGAEDVDVFRFAGTSGATVTLALKAKKKSKLDFTLVLEREDGDPVDLTAGKSYRDRDKSIKAKGVVLPENGTYVVRVSAVGEGVYALKLKAKPQKTFSGRRTVTGAGMVPFEFSAPRGAKVVIKAKRPKDSPAAPMVEGGAVKGAASSLTLKGIDESGLQQVNVSNTADAAGDLDISVKVTPAKRKPEKVDVRASTLGAVPDGGTAISATVESDAGGQVVVPFDDPSIASAGVLIPPGALVQDTRISVATAESLVTPNPVEQQAAGPAIRFGPDGLEFNEDATITLPWDPSSFPVGSDPVTELRVIRVQSDGTEEIIIPTSVDVENGLCTVPTPGFSVFMAFAPRGTPNIEGASFWLAGIEVCILEDDLFNGDSRAREINFNAAAIDFIGPPDLANGVSVQSVHSFVEFSHDSLGSAFTFAAEDPPETSTGSWFYLSDGQSIGAGLNGPEGFDLVEFNLSDDGSLLLNREPVSQLEPCVALELAIRRPETPLTASDVAGTFRVGGLELRAEETGENNPVFLQIGTTLGTITLNSDGTWRARLDAEFERTEGPSGIRRGSDRVDGTGTFRIAGTEGLAFYEGSILLSDDEQTDFLRILPSADGQTILAFHDRVDQGGMFMVGTRASSSFKIANAQGRFQMREMVVEPLTTYTIFDGQGDVTVPDFSSVDAIEQRFDIAASGNAVFDEGAARFVSRSEFAGPGGVDQFTFQGAIFEDEKFTGASDGKLGTKGGNSLLGGFRRDGGFGYFILDPDDRFEPSLTLFIRLPPQTGEPGGR